jgi:uncharacterized protein YqeY
MLLDDIKKRLAAAMKAKHDVEREVLRVALGEIQTLEARTGKAPTDDDAAQIVRKLIKANEETRAATADAGRQATLAEETAVLTSLLPKGMSLDELVAALAPVRDAVRAAGNDGQATGIAIKHLKAAGLSAPGGDVAQAVKALRA